MHVDQTFRKEDLLASTLVLFHSTVLLYFNHILYLQSRLWASGGRNLHGGYVHTVTFLHGFVLFHNPKGVPIYFQTIENDAKTLPCAHSRSF